ncbi:PP2C family protein-serine/threonine phosphatase [Streptomyces sp. NPDC086549]|uniref:PP2C family protein-serine/threonine phosphatase n=1 Tax=Streptomyces sp. NPDC086549 TaxID=3365752 RepID=UPI0038185F8A
MHRVAAVHHEDPDCQEELRPGKTFVYQADTAMARFLAAVEPVLIPQVGEDVLQKLPAELDGPAARSVLKGSSLLLVPLLAHGAALGFMAFGRKPDRPAFVAADLTACEEVAGRAAQALHNARIHSDEATTSAVLQRSLLPTPPPRLPGVEIAYRYHPGSRTTQVGGDWLDVIPLPGHRVGLVIGDVAGHGLHAAVVMGQLRTAVRTLATLDLPPGRLLAQLDAFAQRLGHPHLATCLYCVYDPTTGRSALASAGHLPPVLVAPDGSNELLTVPVGAPIGVGSTTFDTLELLTDPGSLLVLCTDGLVETRGQDIEEALRALGRRLTAQRTPLEDACEALLRLRHPDGHHDDITLLMARLDGLP